MEKPTIQSMDANPFQKFDQQPPQPQGHTVIVVNQTVVNQEPSCLAYLEGYLCISIFSRFLCVPCIIIGCCR